MRVRRRRWVSSPSRPRTVHSGLLGTAFRQPPRVTREPALASPHPTWTRNRTPRAPRRRPTRSRTTSSPPHPQTLVAQDGQRTHDAGAAPSPFPSRPAWQFGWSLSCGTSITVLQGRWGYSDLVTGPSELDSARLRRDLSLALRRRLTVYAGVGATALTVVFSLVAATTAPGKAKPVATPSAQPDPAATSAPAITTLDPLPTTAPIVTPPRLNPPTHAPRPSHHTPPAVVSGGS